MDKHKQRMAIAKACGWIFDHVRGDAMFFIPKGYYVGDPLKDLNAIHEAEKSAFGDPTMPYEVGCLWDEYWGELSNNEEGTAAIACTAAQRAEAFLKTLNLWEGENND